MLDIVDFILPLSLWIVEIFFLAKKFCFWSFKKNFKLKVMKELSHSMKNINQMLIGVFLRFQLWIPTTKSSIQTINQPKVKKEEEESDIFQKPKISFSLLKIFQILHKIFINIKKITNRILKINLRMWNFNKIISI